jgi:hypothetical protein
MSSMEWALEARVAVAALLEYEAKANYERRHDHSPVICTYDLAKFDGGIVVDIMRTHPEVRYPEVPPPEAGLVEMVGPNWNLQSSPRWRFFTWVSSLSKIRIVPGNPCRSGDDEERRATADSGAVDVAWAPGYISALRSVGA